MSRSYRLVERRNREFFAQFDEKLLRTLAVEIFHQSIVVEDRHLMFGEDYRQKIAMRTVALAGCADACGRR